MMSSWLNRRVSRLVIMGAAFIVLSGLPAYADSGGYYTHPNYWSNRCQDAGRFQNGNRCRNDGWYQNAQYQQPQPTTVADRTHDDGNSK